MENFKKMFNHLKAWLLRAVCLYLTMTSAVCVTANDGNLDPATDLRLEARNVAEPGELIFVNLILNNPNEEYNALQLYLDFPNGWTAEKFSPMDAGIGNSTKSAYMHIIPEGRLDETNDHSAFTVIGNVPTDASLRLAVYDGNAEGKNIATGNDAIAVFAIRIPDDASYGNYTIHVRDIWFATISGAGDGEINPFDYTVTVPVTNPVLATSISLNKSQLTLELGASETLTATIQPSNATYTDVLWQSSNSNVATINQNGVVTAVSSGTATITASTTDGTDLSASCLVTAKASATSISLNKSNLTLNNGETYQLTATVWPSNATNKQVSWHSSNTGVAIVNQNGLVTALATGTATITATTTDGTELTASCFVTVVVRATSISLNKSSSALRSGTSETLIATILPENTTNKSVTWSSSNSSIATVDGSGTVTGKAEGIATIYATTKDGSYLSDSCVFTIKTLDPTTSMSFSVANPDDVRPGGIAFVNIILINPNVEYSGFQGDLDYPNGWIAEKFSQADAGIGPKTKKAYCQIIPEGRLDETDEHYAFSIQGSVPNDTSASFRFIVYDSEMEVKKIPKGSDAVAMLAIRVPDSATPGNYSIAARDIWLSTGNYNNEGDGGIDPFSFTITVNPSFIPGDANGDGTVNVSDYVYVANYILEQNPEPFVFAAADIDGNGEINVSDLVLVANIALTYEDPNTLNAPAPKATLNADIDMNATLHKNADGTTSITVDLNNSMDLTALQMDISLPQGMAVTGATLTDRATRSHRAEVAQLANGNYRLLAASSASKAFKGNEGALLTLTLSDEPQGTVTLGGIKLASPDGQCFTVNDILLSPVATGVDDITTQARIYGEAGNIVIESPVNGMAQLVLPNGMSRTVKVKSGRNIYPAPATGLVIVRMNATVAKLLF